MTTGWFLLLSLLGQAEELKDDSALTRTRLAIVNLSAAGVPEEYAAGLTEAVATAIGRTGVFETISPKQIASLIAYEKRKEVLGSCVDEECYTQIARLVRADHLLGGSIARVGDTLTLNLVLLDAKDGRAIQRSNRETQDPTELLEATRGAAFVVLQPLLSARRGYLRLVSNVPEAQVYIDDERRPEPFGQVIPVAAGPHTVKVSQDGFYSATTDVMVAPGRIEEAQLPLIPAKDTIARYERKASWMRYGAYGTGALSLASVALGALFYAQASDEKAQVDRFANTLEVNRSAEDRALAIQSRDRFDVKQGLYLGSLISAVVLGGTSVVLFLTGDDPDRYEEFHSLEARTQ